MSAEHEGVDLGGAAGGRNVRTGVLFDGWYADPQNRGKVLGAQRPVATGAGHHSVLCLPGTDEWYVCYHRRPIPNQGQNHRVVCWDW